MDIQHYHDEKRGRFFIAENDETLAQIVYSYASPQHIIIEHTDVDDKLRGQNVGFQLVTKAVEYARKHNMKITPLCPFAHSVFKKKPEFADVLHTL